MGITLILLGVGCIIGAIVGGGIKLSQLEIAKFSSVRRQATLAAFGLIMMLIGAGIYSNEGAAVPDPVRAVKTDSGDSPTATQPQTTGASESPRPQAAPSATYDIGGTWVDGENARYVFDPAQGAVTWSDGGASVVGEVRVAGNVVQWTVATIICNGAVSTNGRAINANCTEQLSGQKTDIRLVPQ